MEATKTANPPSFESVWAILQENAQGMKELREIHKEYEQERKKCTAYAELALFKASI